LKWQVIGATCCIQDVLGTLLDYEAKIDALRRRSSTIVPVHLRKLPVTSPLRVVALVSYRLSDEVSDQVLPYSFSSAYLLRVHRGWEKPTGWQSNENKKQKKKTTKKCLNSW